MFQNKQIIINGGFKVYSEYLEEPLIYNFTHILLTRGRGYKNVAVIHVKQIPPYAFDLNEGVRIHLPSVGTLKGSVSRIIYTDDYSSQEVDVVLPGSENECIINRIGEYFLSPSGNFYDYRSDDNNTVKQQTS